MPNRNSLLFLILGCVVGFLLGSFVGSSRQLNAINANLTDLNASLTHGIKVRSDVAAIGGTRLMLHRNKNGQAVIGTLPDSEGDTDIHPLLFFDQSTVITP